jgi:GT2 family glycosyltransferase
LNIPDDGFVLFLNPDVLLPDGLLDTLRQVASGKEAQSYAMIGPRLLDYDFLTDEPSGRIDSTGIFPTFWGAWRDRRENSPSERDVLETVPALCGAFLWARAGALRATMLGGEDVFDSRYFAYKEDIELSLRLRRAGWKLGVWHGAFAWHGRGWKTRSDMSRRARVLSARNEVRLHATYARRHLGYSLVKWFYARWLER